MSNSVYPLKIKFLFDENVDARLERFLKLKDVDIVKKSKQLKNGSLAEYSLSEKRILVTNDEDFSELFSSSTIFSVVWLRIPQRNIESSKAIFLRLLEEYKSIEDFKGKLIKLYENKIEEEFLCN